jgi:uncharacterized protein
MGSALFELVIFSLPSMIWTRRLRHSGCTPGQARRAAGLQPGTPAGYALALALVIPVAALATILLAVIPGHVLHGSSKNITGTPTAASGYVAIVLLAIAEEMLFRGFVAGVLFRRLGFRKGNALQALIFLLPHTLLLLVSLSLWPLLPLQLAAGWVLGWLRKRTDSIGPPSVTHALTNLLAAALLTL